MARAHSCLEGTRLATDRLVNVLSNSETLCRYREHGEEGWWVWGDDSALRSEHLLPLRTTWVQFPASMWGSSQPSVTPALEEPKTLDSVGIGSHVHIPTCRCIHLPIVNNNNKNKYRKSMKIAWNQKSTESQLFDSWLERRLKFCYMVMCCFTMGMDTFFRTHHWVKWSLCGHQLVPGHT